MSVVIVNPFSSGAALAPAFTKEGYHSTAVISSRAIPPAITSALRTSDFQGVIYHDDLDSTISQLNDLSPCAVVAGSESGVELADLLSEKMGLRSNGTRLSEARRDKFLQSETVRAAGIRAVQQHVCENVDSLCDWAASFARWPVIVKPLRSTGSDGVSKCYNTQDIRSAFTAIVSQNNKFGEPNHGVLVQEYLDGPQYVIDTMSKDGQHYIATYWKYDLLHINGSPFVYDKEEILPSVGEVQKQLKEYVFKVLDALEIRNGPTMTEVRICVDGPCLVELGARLHGVDGPRLASEAIEVAAQQELMLDVVLQGGTLFDKVVQSDYTLRKHAMIVFLVSHVEGVVRSVDVEQLRSLPGFVDMACTATKGSTLTKTVDLFSSPGRVLLAHDEEAVVRQAYTMLRTLERTTLFDVETSDC
eukprot:GILJ01007104.1.p1 GENE.GILJ01007104.1~~GILJ01007104.1.p1  ORF type:complete len:417 (-),score=47.44 GILJ01007104.1:117-1367(-)